MLDEHLKPVGSGSQVVSDYFLTMLVVGIGTAWTGCAKHDIVFFFQEYDITLHISLSQKSERLSRPQSPQHVQR